MKSIGKISRVSQATGQAASRAAGSTLLVGCLLCFSAVAATAERPPLALANNYDEAEVDLSRYWVSEKYDGVRAYWDGTRLLTRAGHVIHAPDWFIAAWPATPLDGELWAGRGQFETVTATVRDLTPDPQAWRNIRFMVFDLPAHAGRFEARLAALQSLLATLRTDWVERVPHSRISSHAELDVRLQAIADAGGEGLMLHRGDSFYRAERSDDLLKLKPYQDAEAQVVGHLPGQGKYLGMLGALLVRNADGLQFRIGTGFTDRQRREPPPVGSWVTYSYHNVTGRGIPRFARFLRVRLE
jgi:DNA ligase-1